MRFDGGVFFGDFLFGRVVENEFFLLFFLFVSFLVIDCFFLLIFLL